MEQISAEAVQERSQEETKGAHAPGRSGMAGGTGVARRKASQAKRNTRKKAVSVQPQADEEDEAAIADETVEVVEANDITEAGEIADEVVDAIATSKKAAAAPKAASSKRRVPSGKSKAKKAANSAGEPIGKRNVEFGRRGEDAAARFLYRRGYDIIERNWTCAAGEADIVARDGESLVFVEVKTRSSTEKGLPSEAVDTAKRSRYERIAALFLRDYDVVDVSVRFDVVSLVVISPDRALVRHHINAFAAG